MEFNQLSNKALTLLKNLIETPSFSGEEEKTSLLIQAFLKDFGVKYFIANNNVWAKNKYFDPSKPTILLNSHHDTVKPNANYTNHPFKAFEADGKLFGLGSNDAGGALVSLLSLFVSNYQRKNMKYNLVIAATGEEESSGPHGLNSLLKELPTIEFAVVGEPTGMQMAIAEKGLLVIDAYASGIAGHAAHKNTVNPIYKALDDIQWIKAYHFPKVSEVLGEVKMSVTQIDAGTQHNVVPALCHFVIDIRVNEHYTNHEVFEIVQQHTQSTLKARSFHLNASSIDSQHPFVQAGIRCGRKTYGSPTLSDQSVLACPSLKMGPGESKRSHSADEFIYVEEVKQGIELFIKIFNEIL